jgi:hypothetical protein
MTLQSISSAVFPQRFYEQKRTKQIGIRFPESVRERSDISRSVALVAGPDWCALFPVDIGGFLVIGIVTSVGCRR